MRPQALTSLLALYNSILPPPIQHKVRYINHCAPFSPPFYYVHDKFQLGWLSIPCRPDLPYLSYLHLRGGKKKTFLLAAWITENLLTGLCGDDGKEYILTYCSIPRLTVFSSFFYFTRRSFLASPFSHSFCFFFHTFF